MDFLNVFSNLTSTDSRLGFYTKETKERVPEQPGCYAWFLPLWFYRSDLNELMQVVGGVLNYDKKLEREANARFTWESVKLRVRRVAEIQATETIRSTWERVCADAQAKRELQQTMLEASLLMPPLYVGKTKNLRQRYLQHTEGNSYERNDFHTRFTECASDLDLTISVSDLLFVCIKTEQDSAQVPLGVAEDDLEKLVEHILMQFCRPPFSLK